ncbi:hypothetical protein FB451DRAFT_1412333 [Mycena latifolia]|nr:hypothetical protein FB451DRAFT_1412333 [Mycena latifolia]
MSTSLDCSTLRVPYEKQKQQPNLSYIVAGSHGGPQFLAIRRLPCVGKNRSAELGFVRRPPRLRTPLGLCLPLSVRPSLPGAALVGIRSPRSSRALKAIMMRAQPELCCGVYLGRREGHLRNDCKESTICIASSVEGHQRTNCPSPDPARLEALKTAPVKCFRCGENHTLKECPQPPKCFECGQPVRPFSSLLFPFSVCYLPPRVPLGTPSPPSCHAPFAPCLAVHRARGRLPSLVPRPRSALSRSPASSFPSSPRSLLFSFPLPSPSLPPLTSRTDGMHFRSQGHGRKDCPAFLAKLAATKAAKAAEAAKAAAQPTVQNTMWASRSQLTSGEAETMYREETRRILHPNLYTQLSLVDPRCVSPSFVERLPAPIVSFGGCFVVSSSRGRYLYFRALTAVTVRVGASSGARCCSPSALRYTHARYGSSLHASSVESALVHESAPALSYSVLRVGGSSPVFLARVLSVSSRPASVDIYPSLIMSYIPPLTDSSAPI